MKHYYISHQDKITKERNMAFWGLIQNKGKFVKSEWKGDYFVSTYNYNNKIYELWNNMEYGIMSEIIERGANNERL